MCETFVFSYSLVRPSFEIIDLTKGSNKRPLFHRSDVVYCFGLSGGKFRLWISGPQFRR